MQSLGGEREPRTFGEPEAEWGATAKGGRAPILLSCLWKDLPVSWWPLAIFITSVAVPPLLSSPEQPAVCFHKCQALHRQN